MFIVFFPAWAIPLSNIGFQTFEKHSFLRAHLLIFIKQKIINSLHLDSITLKSLEFHGKHGYYDEERQEGNHFELDVIAKGDFKAAIEDDNLDLTFNYEVVKEIAQKVFEGPSEKLIETLCRRIGNEIFNLSPAVKELTVSLRKMNPPIGVPAQYAEIMMTWNR